MTRDINIRRERALHAARAEQDARDERRRKKRKAEKAQREIRARELVERRRAKSRGWAR